MKIALIFPNLRGEFSPTLGLTYLATALAQYHRVSIMDFTFHKKWWKKFLQTQMRIFKPDIIGVSCFTFNFYDGLRIAQEVKKDHPDISIIFGGIHPTLMPIETLKYDEIDAVCIGEGEITFPEYLNNIEKGISLKGVEGIWYKENGQIIKNKIRPLIEDLDSIPFPNWRFWNMDLYLKVPPHNNVIDMLGSRGCPYNCTYCSNHALRQILPGKYLRFRSAENIIEEIKQLKERYWRKGFRHIYFWDENFILDKRIFNRFCQLYKEEGLHKEIIWTVNMRADLITDDWAEKAKKAGCYQVRLGVETGSDYIRNVIYNKKITNEQIKKSTHILKKNDIMMRFNIMLGGPCETIETMKSSVRLVDELQPEIMFFAIFQPLPKTEILNTIKKIRGFVLEDQWKDNPDFWSKSLVKQPHLSQRFLENFTRKTLLKYVWKFFWLGLRMRQLKFLKDLIVFFTKIKPKHHILTIYASYHTIRNYQNEDWKIRNGITL
ncbi:MAG: B12-binding domain-containing radical SAM protein [Candidatus Helarchaeota archaeon]|nr:B12-binding domain-containing radical SAM protein [Candidatus Helarchaeota archaeon]